MTILSVRTPKQLFAIVTFSFLLVMFSFSSFQRKQSSRVVREAAGDCECISRNTSRAYNFCYESPRNSSLMGKKFNCDYLEVLEDLDLLENTLPSEDLSNPLKPETEEITVTAFTDDHFPNFLKSHRQFRKLYPHKKFLIYGLNVSVSTISLLNQHFSSPNDHWEFRAFNYSKYPSYVGNWMEYRFKFLIIAEVLKEYSNVWWNDAHNTIHVKGYMEILYDHIAKEANETWIQNSSSISSIYSNVHTMHSNLAVFNPGLLFYFPVSIPMLKRERQLGANNFYIGRTPQSLEIMNWMVLCSLEKDCMNPTGAQVTCGFSNDFFGKWGKCFRFDQSVLNVLLLNQYGSHKKFKSPVAAVGNAGRV